MEKQKKITVKIHVFVHEITDYGLHAAANHERIKKSTPLT